MPEVHEKGQKIRQYVIEEQIHSGGMALSYKAHLPGGQHVFLKQYIDPSVLVPWYRAYLKYQDTIKARVEASPFRSFTCRFIEFFEFDHCYYQAIEFIDASQSLEKRLERAATIPLTWMQRLTMAKVIVGAVKLLHELKIIHADLKPANVILTDSKARMGYQLKLIDLDFSILADVESPWHGDYGYFGTPGYFSPEHMRGQTPVAASDVFTCGLILYELLAREKQPYRDAPDDAILRHAAKPPTLLGAMPAGNDNQLRAMLHRCLLPLPVGRPTSAQLHEELCREEPAAGGSESKATAEPETSTESEVSLEVTVSDEGVIETGTSRIVLCSAARVEASLGISADVGRAFAARFGADSQFFSEPQFRLELHDGSWYVVPLPSATNQTMLNGNPIAARQILKKGDVLAVGNPTKGVVKLPLTVDFRS